MINRIDFMQDIVKVLIATKDRAEKAAIIADLVLSESPELVARVARRCVIFHWFDESIIASLLENFHPSQEEIRNVYEQIIALPFIEKLPWGFTFHDLTREGLLKLYASTQPDLLESSVRLAAPIYEAHNDDKVIAEALFCYVVAGNKISSKQLFDKLTKQALERDDRQYIDNLQSLLNEARQISFVKPFSLPEEAVAAQDHATEPPVYPTDLTTRELDVLRLLAQGLTSAQIAEQLVIGLVTVNSHVRSIYNKLGVSSRSAATRYAIKHHLL